MLEQFIDVSMYAPILQMIMVYLEFFFYILVFFGIIFAAWWVRTYNIIVQYKSYGVIKKCYAKKVKKKDGSVILKMLFSKRTLPDYSAYLQPMSGGKFLLFCMQTSNGDLQPYQTNEQSEKEAELKAIPQRISYFHTNETRRIYERYNGEDMKYWIPIIGVYIGFVVLGILYGYMIYKSGDIIGGMKAASEACSKHIGTALQTIGAPY